MRRAIAILSGLAVAALLCWLLRPSGRESGVLHTPSGRPVPRSSPSESRGTAAREVRKPFSPGPSAEAFEHRLLRLRVRRAADGAPVPRATVRCWRPYSDVLVGTFATDDAGELIVALADHLDDDSGFRRHRSAHLELDLLVSGSALASASVRDEAYIPGTWWEVRLSDPVAVTGIVRDDRGRALSGARIRSGPEEPDHAAQDGGKLGAGPSTLTDDTGRFRLMLGPGVWIVQADKSDHASGADTLYLAAQDARCDLTLRVRPGLELRVVDSAGAGIGAATVVFRHPGSRGYTAPPFFSGRTDAAGRYVVPPDGCSECEDTAAPVLAFDSNDSVYRARIRGMGEVTLWPMDHPNDGWESRWRLGLDDTRFVSGSIDWGDGPPPDRVELDIGTTQTQLDESARTRAGPNRGSHARASRRRQTVAEAERWVALHGLNSFGRDAWWRADADGRFRMVWFRPGAARVRMRGLGPDRRIRFASASITDAAVQRNVQLVARDVAPEPGTAPIEIRARLIWDADGRPASGVVSALGRGGVSDANGTLRVRVRPWAPTTSLLSERYQVVNPPADGWPAIEKGGDPVDLGTLRLRPRDHITLTLVDASGDALKRGDWRLSIGPPTGTALTGWRRRQDGTYGYVRPTRLLTHASDSGSLPAAPSVWVPDGPGTLTLTIDVPDSHRWKRTWNWDDVPADRRMRVALKPLPADSAGQPKALLATLRGEFTDGAGRSLAGVRVGNGWGGGHFTVVESPWGYHYSDHEGRLVFPLKELEQFKKLAVPVARPGCVARTVHVEPLLDGAGYPLLRIALERAHQLVVWLPGTVADAEFHWQAKGEIEARGVGGVAAVYRVPNADGSGGRYWWSDWDPGDRCERIGNRWRIVIGNLVPGIYEVTATNLPGVSDDPVRVTIQRGQPAEVTIPPTPR